MCEKVLKKARKMLDDSIRGRDYQDELLKKEQTVNDFYSISNRRAIFNTRICVITDLFGKDL